MIMYLSIILLAILLYAVYRHITKNFNYFEKIGLNYARPFSKISRLMFRKDMLGDMIIHVNNCFRNDKVVGAFYMSEPVLFVRDPELIKKIAIKDFDHFQDHQKVMDASDDPLLGNILTMLNGQKWKEMRTTLSPIFTGSKLRHMLELVNQCSIQVTQHFLKENEQKNEMLLDVKDIFSRYTTDVIANCSFGLQVNSLQHPENDFYKMGKEVMNLLRKFSSLVKLSILRLVPSMAARLKLRLLDHSIVQFFTSLVFDTISHREKEHLERPDMINVIMQIRKDGLIDAKNEDSHDFNALISNWTNDELLAQCLMFFLAGFETSSTLLSFLSFELAYNIDLQNELFDEINGIEIDQSDFNVSYEVLQSLKLLDMVIQEGLRKWPPALVMDRICTKECSLEFDNKKIIIEKGQLIWIPIYGLHMNPKYFRNPSKFEPERFSAKNVGNIAPGTYIPFGTGPRSCLGSRFAIMQVKSILFYLLKEFSFEICVKTDLLSIKTGMLKRKPIYLQLKKRKEKLYKV